MRTALLLSLLAGCASPSDGLQACVEESSTYGAGFVAALQAVEDGLIERGALPSATREGYTALIAAWEEGHAMPGLDELCAPEQECWRLTAPASTVAYPFCLRQLAELEASGDLGAEYVQAVMRGLSDEAFRDPVRRGAVIQPITVWLDTVAPDRE